MYCQLIILSIIIWFNDGCLLHDQLKMAARSSLSSDHLRLNNETIHKIYQNVSELMKEIGDGSDSLLVRLNQTSTNTSTLALIVKNEDANAEASKSLYNRFRMYYVQLFDEPAATNGYRIYWKTFYNTFRKQMTNVMQTVWTPVTAISKYLRPSGQHQPNGQLNHHHEPNMFNTFIFPITMKAIDLPSSIEQRIIEIDDEPKTTTLNQKQRIMNNETITNEENQNQNGGIRQTTRKIFMHAITAFRGHLWAQLMPTSSKRPSSSSSLVRNHGNQNGGISIFITDKGVRINLIGEQKSNGDVEFYDKLSSKLSS